jgi:YjbE family integral membrane protein
MMTNTVATALQVAAVNVILSVDNALVIAAATVRLTPRASQRATVVGVFGAVGLRIVIGAAALPITEIPAVRSVAAIILLIVAMRLSRTGEFPEEELSDSGISTAQVDGASSPQFWRAIRDILIGDLAMSFDNVAVVASISDGNIAVLTLGLIACVPILVLATAAIRNIILVAGPQLHLAAIYLGWLAGELILADPGIRNFVNPNSALLPLTIPCACAAWVAWECRIVRAADLGQ